MSLLDEVEGAEMPKASESGGTAPLPCLICGTTLDAASGCPSCGNANGETIPSNPTARLAPRAARRVRRSVVSASTAGDATDASSGRLSSVGDLSGGDTVAVHSDGRIGNSWTPGVDCPHRGQSWEDWDVEQIARSEAMFELIRAKASRQGKPVGEGITCKQAKNWLAGSKGGKPTTRKTAAKKRKTAEKAS